MKKTLTIAFFLTIFFANAQSLLLDPTTSSIEFMITQYSDSPSIVGRGALGSSAAPTATLLNNFLLTIGGRGHDGTNFVSSSRASMYISADENYSPTATGTRLTFNTTTNGTTTQFERMRITNAGNVGIGTATPTEKLEVNGNVNITGKINNEVYIAPTLLNSWVNFGGSHAVAGYYKDKEDRVQLKGLIKDGSVVFNTPMLTLPVGYRPSEILVFVVANSSGFARVDVYPSGDVSILSGSNSFISLSGITFRAMQ